MGGARSLLPSRSARLLRGRRKRKDSASASGRAENARFNLLQHEVVCDRAGDSDRLAAERGRREARLIGCADCCLAQEWVAGDGARLNHTPCFVNQDLHGHNAVYAYGARCWRIGRRGLVYSHAIEDLAGDCSGLRRRRWRRDGRRLIAAHDRAVVASYRETSV